MKEEEGREERVAAAKEAVEEKPGEAPYRRRVYATIAAAERRWLLEIRGIFRQEARFSWRIWRVVEVTGNVDTVSERACSEEEAVEVVVMLAGGIRRLRRRRL